MDHDGNNVLVSSVKSGKQGMEDSYSGKGRLFSRSCHGGNFSSLPQ